MSYEDNKEQNFFSDFEDEFNNYSPWQKMIDERLIYEDARPESVKNESV
jgi:hypothetical protein